MNSFEQQPPASGLHEVAYPNDLRSDGAAVTYVDAHGYTYLRPQSAHDYAASTMLHEAGLALGEVVEIAEAGRLVRYRPYADLLPLSSILNSSIDNQQMVGDVTTAIELVGLFLKRSARKCQLSPAAITLDMFAIDRSSGRAEPLPPYQTGEEPIPYEELLGQLKSDILQRCKSDAQVATIESSFTEALRRLEDM